MAKENKNMAKENKNSNSSTFSNLAEEAENTIMILQNKEKNKIVKTNQLRKILSLVNTIDAKHGRSQDVEITKEVEDMLVDLKIKIAYQSGREEAVKKFIRTSKLNSKLNKILKSKSSKELKDYIKYTEALVAYHKFYVKEQKNG